DTMLESAAPGHSGLELAEPIRRDALEEPALERPDLRRKLRAAGLRNLGFRGGRAPEGAEEPAEALRTELEPAKPNEEEHLFLEDVRARAKVFPRQDAYARLGVQQTATQEQIRAAYLALVKKFHPDRAQ